MVVIPDEIICGDLALFDLRQVVELCEIWPVLQALVVQVFRDEAEAVHLLALEHPDAIELAEFRALELCGVRQTVDDIRERCAIEAGEIDLAGCAELRNDHGALVCAVCPDRNRQAGKTLDAGNQAGRCAIVLAPRI